MQPPATRERRKRHDGSEIDSVASLADFVQSFPASSAEPEESAPSTTATPPAPPSGYEGQTPEQIIAAATSDREKREAAESDAKNAREELARGQRQREIEDTTRRVMAEQQQARPPQAPPPPDPREARIEELWWTDPAEARRLLAEVNDDRVKKQIADSREETKREVFTELTAKQQRESEAANRQVANEAFDTAMQKLRAAGVPETELSDRVRLVSVYSAITLKPTADAPNPYYTDGGPMKADVIAKAWLDLTGRSSAAAAPPPPAVQPAAPPPIIAPPGSSRPSPAAAPPGNSRAVPLSADAQRDISHMAEAFGYDKDKMLQRRRDRLAREKGNQ